MNYLKTYNKIFLNKEYNSDTSISYDNAINFVTTNNVKSVLDVSSGRGHFLKKAINIKSIEKIFSCDLQKNHNIDVNFFELNLTEDFLDTKIPNVDCIVCLDVLEHIEKKYIENILFTFSKKCNTAYFTIANHSDVIDGIELHLIQEDENYWNKIIKNYFEITEFYKKYNDRLFLYSLKSKGKK